MKIQLENLTKIYPSRNKKDPTPVVAVDHFTFEIPDGELIGLLGPSGCGKSTTLNMICGLEKPTEGRLFFGDDDVTKLPPENRGVGMVFQSYALYPHLTVRQNIEFPLENLTGSAKLTKEEMDKKADEAARLVQIDGLMDRRPNELSGGQQQRVAIARALVKMPRVLLLDEPLSNLDARLRLQTREEIRRIQRETGITTVFVTHDQEEAMSISDRIVVMEAGVVQQIGKPQDVYDDPTNLFVAKFLGTPPINVFEGKIKGGKLYAGDDMILDLGGKKLMKDTPVAAGADAGTAAGTSSDAAAEAGRPGASASVKPEHAVPLEARDRDVWVGIRPEGFIPAENGALKCELLAVEVMGRDTSVVAKHPALSGVQIRAIISSETKIDTSKKEVRFDVKPFKTLIFDRADGERIRIAN